ncbi:Alpha-1,3-mannosyltransferase cmt1 [Castilleja foliolosa]|uniref:Alpha-1,3-mannosyltransferase cmt1 n=1 Tax=Castilleja foliolosa TaxID=1961234 RepID=A0ABD3DCN4_9LAMI
MARGKKRTEMTTSQSKPSSSPSKKPKPANEGEGDDPSLIGPPVPLEEAKSRWPHRYKSKRYMEKITFTMSDGSTEDRDAVQAKCHYTKAVVDDVEFSIFDNAYIQSEEGEPHYIGKIVEMFETHNKEAYMCTQWFYRAKDTVIQDKYSSLIDEKRVFYSDIKNDNQLSCIYSKVCITQLTPEMDHDAKEAAKDSCQLYVDMMYSFPHAFTKFYTDNEDGSSVADGLIRTKFSDVAKHRQDIQRTKGTLLDLYSGCGAMSSGLSIGASLDGVTITTKWAVRNEDAEGYYLLLKEWERLCREFNLIGPKEEEIEETDMESDETEIDEGNSDETKNDDGNTVVLVPGEYVVEKILAICYGDPNESKEDGLYFKVRWEEYGEDYDTWEPVDGLGNCEEKMREFVSRVYKAKEIPLPPYRFTVPNRGTAGSWGRNGGTGTEPEPPAVLGGFGSGGSKNRRF